MTKDPVCGMDIDTEKHTFHCEYQNQKYFFCSQNCLNSFTQHPNKYLSNQNQIQSTSSAAEYTCPMHPEIIQDHPGNCPSCGMALEAKNNEIVDDSEYKNMRFRFWFGLIFSIPTFLLAMGSMLPSFNDFIPPTLSRFFQCILSTPVVLWAGWPFFERGWRSITHHLNMFSLISLGIGVSYLYSIIALFFHSSSLLRSYSMESYLFTLSQQLSSLC